MNIELSRRIRRDIPAVRGAVADPGRLPAWQPTLKDVRTLSGRRGEPGSVCELVYDENGREVRLEETVTDSREPELLEFTYRGGQAVSRIRHWFASPAPGETVWTVHCRFRFQGFRARLLAPFMKGPLRRRIDGDMGRLQALLEQEDSS
ncbi:SRPBCC family protein [Lentisalinibacter orientalis]|uniref:SRPBCC family protein n=1 Tax=Lentisalinibacter orientalis TaxID=2992241 RepID=UPI00386F6C66